MSFNHVASLYIMCCPFGGAYWGCWLTGGGPVGPGGPYGPGIGPVWGGYLWHNIKYTFSNFSSMTTIVKIISCIVKKFFKVSLYRYIPWMRIRDVRLLWHRWTLRMPWRRLMRSWWLHMEMRQCHARHTCRSHVVAARNSSTVWPRWATSNRERGLMRRRYSIINL